MWPVFLFWAVVSNAGCLSYVAQAVPRLNQATLLLPVCAVLGLYNC